MLNPEELMNTTTVTADMLEALKLELQERKELHKETNSQGLVDICDEYIKEIDEVKNKPADVHRAGGMTYIEDAKVSTYRQVLSFLNTGFTMPKGGFNTDEDRSFLETLKARAQDLFSVRG